LSYVDYRWAMGQLSGWRRDELDESLERQTRHDPPFYGVVMLAMQRADTMNLAKLRLAWPAVYDELHARYHAPGAILPHDPPGLVERVARSLGSSVEALRQPEPAGEVS
jgi:hypothetical protein